MNKGWKISELTLVDDNFDAENQKHIMRKPNQFTLFFHGEVPLTVYDNVLNIEEPNVPEISFDRIVVEWKPAVILRWTVYFMSKANQNAV